MLICDTHCDTLWALAKDPKAERDLTLERLKKGGVSLQTMALFMGEDTTPQTVQALTQAMLSAYERIKNEGWTQIMDPREARDGTVSTMLSIEGGEIYERDLSLLESFRAKGVRMATLTWNFTNTLATCHLGDARRGLTQKGLEAVRMMQKLRIAVDVSHLNEGGFYDILEKADKPPMASHSCARALCDHTRNLSDDQLKALFEKGGYVGVNFYPRFLKKEGAATLKDIARHMMHMYEQGGEGKVGFGSDFDGIEEKPVGLSNPGDLPALIDALRDAGFAAKDVEDIAGKAFLRYFDRL